MSKPNDPQARYCRNCYFPLSPTDRYCSECSQKNTDGKVTLKGLLSEFFSNYFNFDSNIFLTARALLSPGKLTKAYFQGKHKTYVPPLRLFLVTVVILFTVVSSMTYGVKINEDDYLERAERQRAIQLLDSLTELTNQQYPQPLPQEALDSLNLQFKKQIGLNRPYRIPNPDVFWGTVDSANSMIVIPLDDIVNNTPEQLADKYQIEGFFKRTVFQQQIKVIQDGRGLFRFFIGKLALILFLMMPLLAFILKLLYIRRHFYYVEHLIFSFHYHSFAFVITTLILFLSSWLNGWGIAAGILLILAYQLIAMKRIYQQSKFKTFLKFFLLNILYLFLVVLCFTLGVLISFILF